MGRAWLPGLMLGLAILAATIIACGVIIYVKEPVSAPDDTSPAVNLRIKLAGDDDAGRFKDVIADSAALEKLHALDRGSVLVTARAYYRTGDKRDCLKYIQENFPFASVDPNIKPLLARCQKS
jgi:hypothetical protein